MWNQENILKHTHRSINCMYMCCLSITIKRFGNFFWKLFSWYPRSLVSSSTWFQSPLLALLFCRVLSMWYCNSGQNATLLYSLSLQLPEYLVLVLVFSLLEIPLSLCLRYLPVLELVGNWKLRLFAGRVESHTFTVI